MPRPLVRLLAVLAAPASLLALPAHAQDARPSAPRVTVESGTLAGAVDTSGVLVFRGVPYAAPPVGALRWQPPRAPARWTGVRAAERLGPNCMQVQVFDDIDPFAAGVSEDCLNLNVWTTATAARGTAPRPVMVWIHGGGFFAGFGGEERHDGARLARKGAVVVTLNYRLGAFGFLAHPALGGTATRSGAGNFALLDQIAALRWVQRNVARFGGDPARVTVFGESAGAMSIGALIASPLARGLFHRAILQSGVGMGGVMLRRAAADSHGVRLAAALGVSGTGADALARLRAVSADSILAAVRATQAPPLSFRPVVDGWVVPRPIDSALARGTANAVPVIVGSNRDEDDTIFGAPARAFARLVRARGVPAYRYVFTRAGEDSASRQRGAYHSADITFAFARTRPLLAVAGRAAYDSALAEAMGDYWVAFAATGNPNGTPAAARLPRWPRYDPATDVYLELGAERVARQGYRRAAYDSLDRVWRARGEIRP